MNNGIIIISIPLSHLYIIYIWVNYNISQTWIKAHLGMISLTNHDSSEVAVRSLWFIQIYIHDLFIMYATHQVRSPLLPCWVSCSRSTSPWHAPPGNMEGHHFQIIFLTPWVFSILVCPRKICFNSLFEIWQVDLIKYQEKQVFSVLICVYMC